MNSGQALSPSTNQPFVLSFVEGCGWFAQACRRARDREERIAEHQAGEVEGYTSTRLPVALLFSQEFPTREEALACERQIKGWSRKKKEALMRGDWAEVSRLARRGHPSRASG